MEIYKITNKINEKVYIGQTIRPAEYRFNRHMNDALNNILDTHFAREIRKYGEKIRQTKIGSKNPMAKKIKRINIQTNEVDIFDTVISCAKACGIQNGKTSITTRLNGQVKSPYKNTRLFEYYYE